MLIVLHSGIRLDILENLLGLLLHERINESLGQLNALISWIAKATNVLILLKKLLQLAHLNFQ